MNTVTLTLNTIGTLIAVVSAFYGWRFVVRYRRTNWRLWVAGQHIMKMTLAMTLILTYIVIFQAVAYLIDPNPWIDLAVRVGRLALFGWVCWLLIERDKLLQVSQQHPEQLLTPIDDDDSQTAQTN